MSNKKIKLLTKILEAESLQKQAQETVEAVDEIDEATADRMAQEIYSKIFDEEIAKLK